MSRALHSAVAVTCTGRWSGLWAASEGLRSPAARSLTGTEASEHVYETQ